MRRQMEPGGRGELFHRVLREAPRLLDMLPDVDKASLAAARWSTLEAVLWGCPATLQVHPDDPVLHVLARRTEDGPCVGQVSLCGVRVAARDAGLLLEAAQDMREMLPEDSDCDEEWNRLWMELVWALASRAEGSGAGVTGLSVPKWSDSGRAATQVMAVQRLLSLGAVRDHLRSLSISLMRVGDGDRPRGALVASLLDTIGGLAALQHLDVDLVHCRNCASAWLAGPRPTVATLRLSNAVFHGPGETRAFLDGLDAARRLRHLRLEYVALEEEACRNLVRPPPAHLAAVVAVNSDLPYDWREATNLHTLELGDDDEFGPAWSESDDSWGAVAELMRRSEALRRLKLEPLLSPTDDDALAVIQALPKSTLEAFDVSYERSLSGHSTVTQALVATMRGTTLRELHLKGNNFLSGPDFDVPAVANALGENTTLRVLELDNCGISDEHAESLSDALRRNTALVELGLRYCRLTERGVAVLSDGLRENRGLQVLRLDSAVEEIDPAWIRRILDAVSDRPRTAKLRTLEISQIHVHFDRCARHIASFLSSSRCTLHNLLLYRCWIDDSGMAAIADALRGNASLESLEIPSDSLTGARRESFAEALVENTTLRHLRLLCGEVSGTRSASALGAELLHAQRYAIARRQIKAGPRTSPRSR